MAECTIMTVGRIHIGEIAAVARAVLFAIVLLLFVAPTTALAADGDGDHAGPASQNAEASWQVACDAPDTVGHCCSSFSVPLAPEASSSPRTPRRHVFADVPPATLDSIVPHRELPPPRVS